MAITKVYSTNIVTDNLYIQSNHTNIVFSKALANLDVVLLQGLANFAFRRPQKKPLDAHILLDYYITKTQFYNMHIQLQELYVYLNTALTSSCVC